MDTSGILEIINIAKYFIYGIGLIGLLVLIIGLYKTNRDLIQRGIFTIIAAIVMLICGYFIVKISVNRAEEFMIKEYYENYQ